MYKLHKNGFSLAELLVTFLIMAIIAAVAAPFMTKKETDRNYEDNVVKCVVVEQAASLTSTACETAIDNVKHRKMNAHKTLFFYADHGTAAQQTAAGKVLRQACDEGADKICRYFIESCKKDSAVCDITGSDYDIDYYLRLLVNSANVGRMRIRDITKPWYDLGNTNIVVAVDNACCDGGVINTACDIKGQTGCPYAFQYGGSSPDKGESIAVSGGYIYVTGYESSDSGGGGFPDVFVMKLDTDGTVVWKNQYGGSSLDQGNSLAVSGGYVYVTGYESSDSSGGFADIFVMKLNDADGSVVWKNQYGGSSADYGNSIALSGGYIYVTGIENSDSSGGSTDIFVMKLNDDGTVVWKNQYGGSSADYGYSIAVSGGYIYVTGYEQSDSSGGGYDIFVMKLNDDGTVVWKNQYGGSGSDYGYSMAVSGGNIYVTGIENSDSSGGSADIFVMKLNDEGTVVWKNQYGGSSTDKGSSIAVSGGYIYVTGNEKSDSGGGDYDILVMKLNEDQSSSNITEWTVEGAVSWGLIDDLDGWTVEGAVSWGLIDDLDGWTIEDAIIGWPLEGSLPLDDEVINEWTVGLS